MSDKEKRHLTPKQKITVKTDKTDVFSKITMFFVAKPEILAARILPLDVKPKPVSKTDAIRHQLGL